MKALWIPTVLLALSNGSLREEEIAYAPEEGTTLVRTFLAEAEYSLDSVEMNEEEVELPEEYSLDTGFIERIVVTDEIIEVEDGRPTDLRRTFDELVQESVQSQGDEELERTSISDLEGTTVRFLWDDDDEEYYVEADDEDEELDDSVAEWLREDMDFRLVLPEDAVEEGDSWEIEAEVYLGLMWPGGLLGFYDEDQAEPDEFDRAMSEQTIENLSGEGQATFEEIREEDDLRLAVLRIELSIETESSGTTEQGETEMDVSREIDRDLEGEILWDLDAGRIHSASFETDSDYSQTVSGVLEGPEGEFDLEQTRYFTGSIDYTVEIEEE